jgi:hypothetical protein
VNRPRNRKNIDRKSRATMMYFIIFSRNSGKAL